MSLIIILILTCILNVILINCLPFAYQNLSIFTPMFLVVLLPFINYFIKNKRIYFIVVLILAIIHDILYSGVFLLTFIAIVILAFLNYLFYEKYKFNLINLIITTICSLIIYDAIIFFILNICFNYNYLIGDLFYKISHSILSNILLVLFMYFIIYLIERLKKK